jgi:hypothetical protein
MSPGVALDLAYRNTSDMMGEYRRYYPYNVRNRVQ